MCLYFGFDEFVRTDWMESPKSSRHEGSKHRIRKPPLQAGTLLFGSTREFYFRGVRFRPEYAVCPPTDRFQVWRQTHRRENQIRDLLLKLHEVHRGLRG